MAAPVDPQAGLARAFAEFWLLPDLLAAWTPGAAPPESWVRLLEREGYTVDHIEDEQLPEGPDLASIMAADAWRVARWLELLDDGGVTDAGSRVAQVAQVPFETRNEAAWRDTHATLAQQIRTCYRGAGGASIADLLQTGANVLAEAEDVWTRFCPGLLLAEIEALLYLAHADAERAIALASDLAKHRVRAMRDYPPPMEAVDEILNMSAHADAVSRYFIEDLPGHINESVLTLTAAQATAILFVYCGLLKPPKPYLPVQYLVAPRD